MLLCGSRRAFDSNHPSGVEGPQPPQTPRSSTPHTSTICVCACVCVSDRCDLDQIFYFFLYMCKKAGCKGISTGKRWSQQLLRPRILFTLCQRQHQWLPPIQSSHGKPPIRCQSDVLTSPASCASDAVRHQHPFDLKNVASDHHAQPVELNLKANLVTASLRTTALHPPFPIHTDFIPLQRLCSRITNLFPGFFYPPHCKRPNPSKLKALIRLDSMTDELVFQAKLNP